MHRPLHFYKRFYGLLAQRARPQPLPFCEAVAKIISGRGGVTLGPPIFRLMVPFAASTESRTSSEPVYAYQSAKRNC